MIRVTLTLAAVLAAAPALAQDNGHDVYMTNCSACHQAAGEGMKGVFPDLVKNRTVTGDPATVIGVVVNGRGGMPGFKADLTDAQIAAAVSYIRSAWGNAASAVTPGAVAAVRAGGSH